MVSNGIAITPSHSYNTGKVVRWGEAQNICTLHAVVGLCVFVVLRLRFNDSAPSTGVL